MGWILRKSDDRTNPTLPGGVYGLYITAGRGVYWTWDGARIRFILFISDGGRYGMDSSALRLTYKGVDIIPSEFRFHPGTLTKQINPFLIESVNNSTNRFTSSAHGFADGDRIRIKARLGGTLPAGAMSDKKYFVISRTVNTFQISESGGGESVDLTTDGSGNLMVWKADAGFDDPVQGLPELCPEVNTTFSGICYIEGMVPAQFDQNEEPDWDKFRVEGIGRKMMNYDDSGSEIGVISGSELLKNPGLSLADCAIVEYQKPVSRVDFASLNQLKAAASALVWQRTDTDSTGTITGTYYNLTDSIPPDVGNAVPILTRRENSLNLDFGSEPPGAGVNSDFIAVWEFRLKTKFSENFTFTVARDNGARIYFDGVLVFDQWFDDVATEQTFNRNLTAGDFPLVRIEYFDGDGPGNFKLEWQSASLAREVISRASAYDPDLQIPRYEANLASAAPTEASEYFERIMSQCPGWDWTDVNGKITFLPPTRAVVYEFVFDAEDLDTTATFIDKTFQKKIRHRRDRKNFEIYSFRNRRLIGYPEGFVEVDRPRLRELGGGIPNNDPPRDLQVLFEDQAQRIADMDFALTSDPEYFISLEAHKKSGVVTKNCFVRVRNWVKGDRHVEDSRCIATIINRRGNKLEFTLLPVKEPFYSDEPVSV